MLFVYSQPCKKPIKRNLRKRNRTLNLSISYSDAVEHPSATIRRSGVCFPVKSEYLEFGSSWNPNVRDSIPRQIGRSGFRFLVKSEGRRFDSILKSEELVFSSLWNSNIWVSIPHEIRRTRILFLVKSEELGFDQSWETEIFSLQLAWLVKYWAILHTKTFNKINIYVYLPIYLIFISSCDVPGARVLVSLKERSKESSVPTAWVEVGKREYRTVMVCIKI